MAVWLVVKLYPLQYTATSASRHTIRTTITAAIMRQIPPPKWPILCRVGALNSTHSLVRQINCTGIKVPLAQHHRHWSSVVHGCRLTATEFSRTQLRISGTNCRATSRLHRPLCAFYAAVWRLTFSTRLPEEPVKWENSIDFVTYKLLICTQAWPVFWETYRLIAQFQRFCCHCDSIHHCFFQILTLTVPIQKVFFRHLFNVFCLCTDTADSGHDYQISMFIAFYVLVCISLFKV